MITFSSLTLYPPFMTTATLVDGKTSDISVRVIVQGNKGILIELITRVCARIIWKSIRDYYSIRKAKFLPMYGAFCVLISTRVSAGCCVANDNGFALEVELCRPRRGIWQRGRSVRRGARRAKVASAVGAVDVVAAEIEGLVVGDRL